MVMTMTTKKKMKVTINDGSLKPVGLYITRSQSCYGHQRVTVHQTQPPSADKLYACASVIGYVFVYVHVCVCLLSVYAIVYNYTCFCVQVLFRCNVQDNGHSHVLISTFFVQVLFMCIAFLPKSWSSLVVGTNAAK